jgi:TetR/AcrR family transcriptional regulator, repressor of fatR-cypB operon
MKKLRDKKLAIYRATRELISKNGFHGTPMSQIAREAEVSVGNIYHYFPSKEELLNKLYLEIKKKFAAHVIGLLNYDLPDDENLQQMLFNIFNYYFENWKDLSFVEQYENSPLIDHASHKSTAVLLIPIIQLFEKAKKKMILKPLRTEILISLSFGAVVFLAKSYISLGMILNDQQIDTELKAVWDMIKHP